MVDGKTLDPRKRLLVVTPGNLRNIFLSTQLATRC